MAQFHISKDPSKKTVNALVLEPLSVYRIKALSSLEKTRCKNIYQILPARQGG